MLNPEDVQQSLAAERLATGHLPHGVANE